MKKTMTLMMLVTVLTIAMAASAFANPYNSYNYVFNYNNAYHAHSSSYIAANAVESGGNVTIQLTGNYFPEVEVGGLTYTGSYNASTNVTTFTFPGSSASNIAIDLHVQILPYHDVWYALTLVWG